MTILVIDDDEDFRRGFADALRHDGHRVEELTDAPSVKIFAALEKPDVVVVDYHLSGQNGVQFADAFHALHPTTPVIVVTIDPSGMLESAISSRPHTLLRRKPFTYAELLELIEAI
jgi:DNA-binding NtrC family response regulator